METTATAAEWEGETVTNPADTGEPAIPMITQEAAMEATAATVEWEEGTTINPPVDTEDPMTLATTLADNLEASQAALEEWSLSLSRREFRPLREPPRRRVGKYHLLS